MTIGAVRYEVQRVQGGNGYWKQRYQTRVGRGYYILPVQYNEVQKTYTVYNGTNWYDGSNAPRFTAAYGSDALVVQMDALNNGIDMKGTAVSWENRCAGCHQTGMTVQVDTATYGGTSVTEVVTGYVELNIGCEACHGPGAAHAASHNASDIVNPGTPGSRGSAGERGVRVVPQPRRIGHPSGDVAADGGPGAPAGSTVVPFLPGNNLLNDLLATGAFVTLTTTASNFWGSVHFASADVNGKFPLYTASKSHHQQYMDIGQGPHAAESVRRSVLRMPLPALRGEPAHDRHDGQGGRGHEGHRHEGEETTRCAWRAHRGLRRLLRDSRPPMSNPLRTADLPRRSTPRSLGHMIRRANMDVPIDLGAGRGAVHRLPHAEDGPLGGVHVVLPGCGREAEGGHPLPHDEGRDAEHSVRDVTSTFFNASATDNGVATSMPNSFPGLPQGERHRPARPPAITRCTAGPAPATPTISTTGSAGTRPYRAHTRHGGRIQLGLQRRLRPLPHRGRVRRRARRRGADGPFHPADGEELPDLRHVPRLRGPGREPARAPDRLVLLPERPLRVDGRKLEDLLPVPRRPQFEGERRRGGPLGRVLQLADVDPHLLPAAAILYGPQAQGGYEYDGKSYAAYPYHTLFSCSGCHMAGPSGNWNLGGHSLAMTDGSAVNTTGCVQCHGAAITSFDVRGNDRLQTLTDLLGLLATKLAEKGVSKRDPFVSPYFDNVTTPVQLRAAYNYKYVSADPGRTSTTGGTRPSFSTTR